MAMQELNFDFEVKQIKINGHVFDILRSDIDILEKADKLLQKYDKELQDVTSDTEEGRKKITAAILEIRDYIDEILGQGALRKISGGKPVGLTKAINVMKDIAAGVVRTYHEDVGEEYAIDEDEVKEKPMRATAKKRK